VGGTARPPPIPIDVDLAENTIVDVPAHAPPTLPMGALPAIGDVVAGFYTVERCIGTGGMGHVYAARHVKFGQRIAVKVLNPTLVFDDDARERFAREVKALQTVALESRHAVRVFDVGHLESGLPFIAMEYLDGKDLGVVLEERGALPVQEACHLLVQACEAVQEAHEAGIVHRDLKPKNLFLTYPSGHPCVRVLDFGIARALHGALGHTITRAGDVIGTLTYMAPEQIREATSADLRSDIWALGACLYKLLTNRPPFSKEAAEFGLIQAILLAPPTPIVRYRDDVPPTVDRVVMRCLEKDPGERFQTVSDLAGALAAAG
jgi:serine/threonine-protein kinase